MSKEYKNGPENGKEKPVPEKGEEGLSFDALLKELADLLAKAREQWFWRAKRAYQLLHHRDWRSWVVMRHGGSEDVAVESINDDYFKDIKGFLHVVYLARMYEQFPKEEEWKRLGYDLYQVFRAYEKRVPRMPHPKTIVPRATKNKLVKAQEKNTELAAQVQVFQEKEMERGKIDARQEKLLDQKESLIGRQAEEISRLKEENKQLREENLQLRRRLGEAA